MGLFLLNYFFHWLIGLICYFLIHSHHVVALEGRIFLVFGILSKSHRVGFALLITFLVSLLFKLTI